MSAPSDGMQPGYSRCETTELELQLNLRSRSLGCLRDCTIATVTQEQASVSPFVSVLSSAIMGGSGSNPNPGKVPASVSRSPSDVERSARRQVLIVEDSLADITLIRMAMERSGVPAEIRVVGDGEEAVRLFENADLDPAASCPDLVILDLNLPRFKGSEVLRRLRASARCATVPVLVVTSSDSSDDREQMKKLGANGYFRKPSELSEYM